MAKKFVRGITDIKTINNQDFDTNNVNDLLSDGEHNYIHRKKKDKSEEYHNLTDNIKTISSSNTDLIEVTNNNTTNNTATLNPKHDTQKEQVLESTRSTITIAHGANGTSETTKVDTNPQKVLEHENLSVGDGLSVSHSGNKSTIKIEPTYKEAGLNLDNLESGAVHGTGFVSSVSQKPTQSETTFLTFKISNNSKFQISIRDALSQPGKAIVEYRFIIGGVSTNWMVVPTSMNEITSLLAQKQNTIQPNTSIGVSGNGLRQLYTLNKTYTHANGLLKTHVKSVSVNTNVNNAEEEFNFIVKINRGATSATFTLNEHDKTKFSNIINNYGQNNTVNINGCVFTLSGSTLTVSTANNTEQNYVITFSDII